MDHHHDGNRRAQDPLRVAGSGSLGLVTDLYQLTMASSYLARGLTQPATFSLFVRHLPPNRSFLVASGIDDAVDLLESFAFDDAALDWLSTQGFDAAAIDALGRLRFSGDVWAVPEGRVVFPNEPLIEVTAPLPEAQIVEALVLNQVTYQTALATKAARCTLAAAGRADLVDFSLRRTHGIEAGMAAARAAAIAGFVGTSNMGAARRFGLRSVGTMAHSYVTAFPDEYEAFTAFAEDFPDRATFVVDTYDTLKGVDVAIDVIDRLQLRGRLGVRLDSGDLLDLSVLARRRLDEACHHDVAIVASGGLDEFEIKRLLDAGAPIDVFGVGTKVGVAADAPSLDSAYKLVEFNDRPLMKQSSGKATMPGPKQVHRLAPSRDVLATRSERPPPDSTPVLTPVMVGGARRVASATVGQGHERLLQDLAWLSPELKVLKGEQVSPVTVSEELEALTRTVQADIHQR
ncbi:MAG: nicotinate phosphoribosyltransferase [Actinomycetia bacterium]|nr:nicotinate phosphoribosyltransferase [Actinomycetes bacterium]